MAFNWNDIPTAEAIEAGHALTASLDPAFSRRARTFWETRTPAQLAVLQASAWSACDVEQWAKARFYAERLSVQEAGGWNRAS